uniref:Uncharacterized protein n=1 Tax=Odontella aurita TaxID=265563 RepID=A0A7S4J318_9STRA|mmetsp:Transcript_37070/g.111036  ORF Transcript_37070/g.111036 Transcript_37070/m.111036 type:complete len:476 (+) Transcript_37070:91-1518(+)
MRTMHQDSAKSSVAGDGRGGTTRWRDFALGVLLGALSMSAYHDSAVGISRGKGGGGEGSGASWQALSGVVLKAEGVASASGDGDSAAAAAAAEPSAAAVMSMSPEEVDLALEKMGVRPIRVAVDASANATGNATTKEDPEWKEGLFRRLNRILLICGDLCRMNSVAEIEKRYSLKEKDGNGTNEPLFPTVVTKNFQCPSILASEDIDAGDMSFPSVPPELADFFTLGGALGISPDRKRRDAYLGGESETKLWPTGSLWREDDINECAKSVAEGTLKGSYGIPETNMVRDQIVNGDPDRLRDKSVLVIGSSHPWVECICLHHGARLVTTLEYGTIDSRHPRIHTETPEAFRAKYLNGTLGEFDGVVTHSSLEHSGLGRYGDALNPWGDILALARAWCVTRANGFLWLGLPTGKDFTLSNWHRVYGKIRLPLVATNWRQLGPMTGIRSRADEEEIFKRGKWKSMSNVGHLFEKVVVG